MPCGPSATPPGFAPHGATGVLDPDEPDVPMRRDTVFDAANLTKVLAVWSSIGL